MKKLLFALLICVISVVQARDIKFIVPYSPGGSSDRVARTLETALSNKDYNFVIEYRLGAGGSLAAETLAQLQNDTAIMITSNGFLGNSMISGANRYNALKDFVLVEYLGIEPLLLVTHADTGIGNFAQFQQAMSQKPLPYGSSGVGTSGHISAAIIANKNPKIFNVPYKGGAALINDLIANRVSWAVESDLVLASYIKNKNVVLIAVHGRQRLSKYPDVPTLKELGVDDRDFYRWHIIVANLAADPAVIAHVQKRLQDPAVRQLIENLGIDTTAIKNPQDFLSRETAKTQKIVRDYNISN